MIVYLRWARQLRRRVGVVSGLSLLRQQKGKGRSPEEGGGGNSAPRFFALADLSRVAFSRGFDSPSHLLVPLFPFAGGCAAFNLLLCYRALGDRAAMKDAFQRLLAIEFQRLTGAAHPPPPGLSLPRARVMSGK